MKKTGFVFMFLLAIHSQISVFASHSDIDQKPNILLIISDQMVPMLTGAYGHPIVKTPYMDRLVKSGIRFDAAYSNNPLCAPARAVILTGRYSSNIRVYDNAAPLASDVPTINHYLNRAGYQTILSGKIHFVGPDQLHGFQMRLIGSHYPTDFQWVKSRDQKIPRPHAGDYVEQNLHIGEIHDNEKFDELAQEKAIEYLKQKKHPDPFFLCVSYNYPHEPFWPPKKYWDMYKDEEINLPEFPEDWESKLSIMDRWLTRHSSADQYDVTDPASIREVRRAYYALITYVDDKIGELLSALDESGLDENTIIVFTSDHGDMLGEKGMVQKRSFYEWSARVPLIIKYPDERHADIIQTTPVSLVDLMPTMLDWAGIPEQERLEIDGKSLVPLMNGEIDEDRYVLMESHSEGVYTTCFSVVKGDYKYNYFTGYGSQLFNLKKDPDEWENLSGQLEYLQLENDFRTIIFNHFDPAILEIDIRNSIKSRFLIQSTLEKQGIDWEYVVD